MPRPVGGFCGVRRGGCGADQAGVPGRQKDGAEAGGRRRRSGGGPAGGRAEQARQGGGPTDCGRGPEGVGGREGQRGDGGAYRGARRRIQAVALLDRQQGGL